MSTESVKLGTLSPIGARLLHLLTADRAAWFVPPRSHSSYIDHPCGVSLCEIAGAVIVFCDGDNRDVLTEPDHVELAPLVAALSIELHARTAADNAALVRAKLGMTP